MDKLYINNGTMMGHSYDLDKDVTIVGRGRESDIRIKEKSISRKHVKIIFKDNRFYIEDLKSHNGTLVNDKPIETGEEVEVSKGSPVKIGNILISLGKRHTENGMVTDYSIDLSGRDNKKTNQLYKNRRVTNRKKLELLHEISTLFMESLDIYEICQKIVDALFRSLPRIDNGAIILLEGDSGELKEVISKVRDKNQSIKTNYSRTIVNRVITESKALMMSDTSMEERDKISESMEMMKVKSIMCVPLICKNKVLGVIYVHSSNSPYGFDKDDLHLFTGLSAPAALAIENAMLYSGVKRAEEEIRKAHDTLEDRIRERTSELTKANDLLKKEIDERMLTEKELKLTHDRLRESNRNLEQAYSLMRDKKDLLSMYLQGISKGFLLNKTGVILGVTVGAMELTGISRLGLIGRKITSLVEKETAGALDESIRDAWKIGLAETSFRKIGTLPGQDDFRARIITMNADNEKLLLMLMIEPEI
jgi:GAF domain-containing protein